jgi:hypothetical protein
VVTALDLPPSAEPWARDRGLLLWKDVESSIQPAHVVGNETEAANPASQSASPLALLSPGAHSIFHITPTLPLADQRIQLKAAGENGLNRVRLWVDGQPVEVAQAGQDVSPYVGWWALVPGKHTAWADALRADGSPVESEKIEFEVVGETIDSKSTQ